MSLGKDDSSFPKTVEKPPESSSTSGSINTAENMTLWCDLDCGDKKQVNILLDLHESQGLQLRNHLKVLMED